MMFANVLLINLLVALFATTYERVQENSENIWKLNRYDLILEYWGKSPLRNIVAHLRTVSVPCRPTADQGRKKYSTILSCTPFVSIEHVLILFKTCIFCRHPQRNKIVCWPRSPGDHALNLEQFPIEGFNATAEDFDRTISELIDFEQRIQVKKLKRRLSFNHIDFRTMKFQQMVMRTNKTTVFKIYLLKFKVSKKNLLNLKSN